jgi:hypothetical protein
MEKNDERLLRVNKKLLKTAFLSGVNASLWLRRRSFSRNN